MFKYEICTKKNSRLDWSFFWEKKKLHLSFVKAASLSWINHRNFIHAYIKEVEIFSPKKYLRLTLLLKFWVKKNVWIWVFAVRESHSYTKIVIKINEQNKNI